MNQDKIGKFIKKIRLENNLTQKQLADTLGVTYQAVSKWENGKNIPDIELLKEISERFNINIDEILNGEKRPKKKNNYLYLFLIPVVLIIIVLFIFLNKDDSFEFKTISSNCSDFKITGSAAYNKEKTSLYISNIEFCGKEEKEEYKEINCILYEKNNNKKIKISSCDKKNSITLKEFLKNTNIKVSDYKTVCKNLTSTNLLLEIYATKEDNNIVTYKVPIKLNDNCK
ncbi:MAG: helix-turn-helix transcriptional regulator [Bacilli bacterium]|nr:helix-turn-helix transcriptional regulator [Bacilli bacterium]